MRTDVITIRPLLISEIYMVAKHIPKFYQEFGEHPMGAAYRYNQAMFIRTWTAWLRMPEYILLGAFDGDEWIGGLGGMISSHPYTLDTLTGYEHFWYVIPERRKDGVGKQLIDAFEAWLKERDVKFMMMVYIHGGPSEMMAKFYEKEGFMPFETQVLKSLQEPS